MGPTGSQAAAPRSSSRPCLLPALQPDPRAEHCPRPQMPSAPAWPQGHTAQLHSSEGWAEVPPLGILTQGHPFHPF